MTQKLLLHIGLHKTGTSYIQRMFANNLPDFRAKDVRPAGIFNAVEGHHHRLLLELKEGREDAFHAALDEDPAAPRGERETQVLVSTEGFATWLSRNDDATNLRFAERLRERFDLRVVLMLRRQDFLKESVYAEVATNGYRGSIEGERHYFYNFDRMLTRLEAAFGQEAIGLGVYRDDVRQNLMADFLELAQIPLEASALAALPPQRISLHRRKVALLSELDKKPRERFRRVRKEVAESDVIVDDGIKYQMSPEARRDFLRPFQKGNRRVAERYGLGAEVADYLSSDQLHPVAWAPPAAFSEAERRVVARVLASEENF